MINILVNKLNPNINVQTTLNYYSGYDKVKLNDINYRLAFTVESFDDKKIRHDPKYIKYIARIWNEVDGVQTFTNVPLHECTQDDFDEFYPIEPNSEKKFESIRA